MSDMDISPSRIRKAMVSRLSRFRATDLHRQTAAGPMLSLSFDDVPRTAVTTGAKILSRYGVPATWFVSGGLESTGPDGEFFMRDDLRALFQDGHELGCHGFSHIDHQESSMAEIRNDLDQNAAFFDAVGLPPARAFAYPFGRARPEAKAACGQRFEICRGVRPSFGRGVMDFNLLPSFPLYSRSLGLEETHKLIDDLANNGGLLSFFSHGVTDDPTVYDCTPGHLEDTLAYAQSLDIPIAPLTDAVRSIFKTN